MIHLGSQWAEMASLNLTEVFAANLNNSEAEKEITTAKWIQQDEQNQHCNT